MNQQQNTEARNKLESMVLSTIQNKLNHEEITAQRASEIARKILQLIPENISYEQLIALVPKIDDEIPELALVVHNIMNEQDEKLKAHMLPKLRAWLAQQK